MILKETKILAPCGILGYGFPDTPLEEVLMIIPMQ